MNLPAPYRTLAESAATAANPEEAQRIADLIGHLEHLPGPLPAVVVVGIELGIALADARHRAQRRQGGLTSAAGRKAEAEAKAEAWQEIAEAIWQARPRLSKRRTAEIIAERLNTPSAPKGVMADPDTIRRAIRKPVR